LAAVAERHYNSPAEYEKQARKVHGIVVAVVAMIFIHNLSSAFLIYAIIITMMAITKLRTKLLVRFVVLTFIVAFTYSFLAQQVKSYVELPGRMDTWTNRIVIFLYPEEHPNETRQPDAAQISILEGAFNPTGPGRSPARYVLSQAQSDYIFALIIGELSIITGTFVLILYFVIFYRGVLIVQRSETVFPAFLALGFTLMITMQAFLHIAVTVGLGPVTGQPLPLVSTGGTSLLVSGFAMGVLLNASAKINQEEILKRKKNQPIVNNPLATAQSATLNEQQPKHFEQNRSESINNNSDIPEIKSMQNIETTEYSQKQNNVTETEFSVTTKESDFYVKSNYTLNQDANPSSEDSETPKDNDFSNTIFRNRDE